VNPREAIESELAASRVNDDVAVLGFTRSRTGAEKEPQLGFSWATADVATSGACRSAGELTRAATPRATLRDVLFKSGLSRRRAPRRHEVNRPSGSCLLRLKISR
jgi:hypothetical protein